LKPVLQAPYDRLLNKIETPFKSSPVFGAIIAAIFGAVIVVVGVTLINHSLAKVKAEDSIIDRETGLSLSDRDIEAREAQREAQQREEDRTRAPKKSSPWIGDTVRAKLTVPCGSTPAALDQASLWVTRGDRSEAARTLIATHSAILTAGDLVKIVDSKGYLLPDLKVRFTRSGMEFECWVSAKAVLN